MNLSYIFDGYIDEQEFPSSFVFDGYLEKQKVTIDLDFVFDGYLADNQTDTLSGAFVFDGYLRTLNDAPTITPITQPLTHVQAIGGRRRSDENTLTKTVKKKEETDDSLKDIEELNRNIILLSEIFIRYLL